MGSREILEAAMKNVSLMARLRRVSDGLLPTDPDANIIVIRVRRSNRADDGRFLDSDQEVDRARASLQMPGPEDRAMGEYTRGANESEHEFMS